MVEPVGMFCTQLVFQFRGAEDRYVVKPYEQFHHLIQVQDEEHRGRMGVAAQSLG